MYSVVVAEVNCNVQLYEIKHSVLGAKIGNYILSDNNDHIYM